MALITVENLTKKYQIVSAAHKHTNFREILTQGITSAFARLTGKAVKKEYEEVNALDNISFDVERGDRVGIIGRNGSGKSTLLKVLSRITTPTSGMVRMNGRVASLLEVGTGFHPELSGRENIYMNGVILGMKRAEVNRRFDEIVEFSGVGKFLDTPVKRYSSGMTLRLAFSVAAHLNSDILIIDEVLAVGDHQFQQKCLNVMSGLGEQGRTLLFVSHNLGVVKKLCNKAVHLKSGKLVKFSTPDDVVSDFLLDGKKLRSSISWQQGEAPGNELVSLQGCRVLGADGKPRESFSVHDEIRVEIDYQIKQDEAEISIFQEFYDMSGTRIFTSVNTSGNNIDVGNQEGYYTASCTIPRNFLNDGDVFVSIAIFSRGQLRCLHERNAVSFSVYDEMKFEGARGNHIHQWPQSFVRPLLEWKTYRRTE